MMMAREMVVLNTKHQILIRSLLQPMAILLATLPSRKFGFLSTGISGKRFESLNMGILLASSILAPIFNQGHDTGNIKVIAFY